MKKTIITIITALLMIQLVVANPIIDWLTPSQNGEIIDNYPQSIKFVARDSVNMINCITNISNQGYNTTVGTTTVDITINTKLTEGSYNVTINCTNGVNSTQETKTITIDDMTNFSKQREENKKIYLYIFIMTSLSIIFISQKKNIYRLLIGVIGLISSIIIYTQINETLLVIPITLTTIITLTYLIKSIFKA